MLIQGGQVVAVVQIAEEEEDGTETVHAELGERGEVVGVVEGWVMVEWTRTGTVTSCDAEELAEICGRCWETTPDHHPLCANAPTPQINA